MDKTDLREPLKWIPVSECTYLEWTQIGMALKHEGYDCGVWDDWSRNDSRYHPGDCQNKWRSFHGAPANVTGGTICHMAMERGWEPVAQGHEIGWDDYIGSEGKLIDASWVESAPLEEPQEWNPVQQLTTYIETLFSSDEYVGYCTESFEHDGRHSPGRGAYDRTAEQLLTALSKCNGDISYAVGDCNPAVGAWIRFNPLDGKGVKNANVTDYRYALVESDSMDVAKQRAMMEELNLPIACLVHSGGKSIHAIVRVEAPTYEEYRRRVDYLYNVLRKNGMDIDTQNKNPSRLSRMPGIMRNGKKQWLIATNIGAGSWDEWREWLDEQTDDLPDVEDELFDELPPLNPELIEGVLRTGHKMLISGPSKAGKSYALIELCIAISEGLKWLGFQCRQGKVMYVNLELDHNSCLHRFREVRSAMDAPATQPVTIWNLRGKSVPMDKLAPMLIRRAAKGGYTAIVIDPIYKVITGDENSADQMAAFCNQFDKVCTSLNCAVIYCHHHSKGGQSNKRAADRASGSGVFARDPDAQLDMLQIEPSDGVWKVKADRAACDAAMAWLKARGKDDRIGQDEALSRAGIIGAMRELQSLRAYIDNVESVMDAAEHKARHATAWRMEGSLREFPAFDPVHFWFDYPVHTVDDTGALKDAASEDTARMRKVREAKKKSDQRKQDEQKERYLSAFHNANPDGNPTVSEMAAYLNVQDQTVRKWLEKFGLSIDKNSGKVVSKELRTE